MGRRPGGVQTQLLVESGKTPLLGASKTDPLEARRGKGLAMVSPLGEAEGEKVKGEREEIWREKEEEPASPPFFLSSLPPLPPSLFPPPSSPFFPLAVFLGESGGSELNRKRGTFILYVVTFGCRGRERARVHGRTRVHVEAAHAFCPTLFPISTSGPGGLSVVVCVCVWRRGAGEEAERPSERGQECLPFLGKQKEAL